MRSATPLQMLQRLSRNLRYLHQLADDPMAALLDAERVLLLGPPKVERRAIVSADHQIIMLLGDTLHDFDARFRKTPLDAQRKTVADESGKWGWNGSCSPMPDMAPGPRRRSKAGRPSR